ncbi:uncharacterized protein LOC128951584 [Oppia nitens]|uniref:uncharacterized protein LOC128951584 n=1 Tax=Oppia nitens TaxID=1686743 RepID=UPI0023DC62AC|nr:uncharacterized protein LOC128951584 [Oppia nitens]
MSSDLKVLSLFVVLVITIISNNNNVVVCVISRYLCRNSTIDAITYVNEMQMYWLSSGSHFWWIKEEDLPNGLTDENARTFDPPLTGADAAVYVDSQKGCNGAPHKSGPGIESQQRQVWVIQLIGSVHQLQAWDALTKQWVKNKQISYSTDNCIGRANVDWSTDTRGQRPMDAMFAVNYLFLYFVMDTKVAAVDCSYVCKDPNGFSDSDYRAESVTDWLSSKEKIYSIFVKNDNEMFVFFKTHYQIYKVSVNDQNRQKLPVTADGKQLDIFKDFLKITKQPECQPRDSIGKTTLPSNNAADQKPSDTVTSGHDSGSSESADASAASDGQTDDGGNSSSIAMIIVIVGVVVVAVIAIAFLAFLMLRRKSSSNKSDPNTTKKPSVKEPAKTQKSIVSKKTAK